MSGLKKYNPALRFGQDGTAPPVGAITPDEIDSYVVYNVINPSVSNSWIGTRKSGTADVKAVTVTNAILDYPRNLEFAITGSSVGMAGTLAVNGGTIAAFVNVPMSAVASPADLAGSYSLTAWVKPTFNPENYAINADLPQRV